MCSEAKIPFEELRHMNLNDVFDRVYKYVDLHDPDREPKKKVRKATQADIDRLL